MKWISYVLLFAFGVLFTPRELVHHCDSHHETEKSSHLSFEKKCYACDYDIHAALTPISFDFKLARAFYPSHDVVEIAGSEAQIHFSFSLRGPPFFS